MLWAILLIVYALARGIYAREITVDVLFAAGIAVVLIVRAFLKVSNQRNPGEFGRANRLHRVPVNIYETHYVPEQELNFDDVAPKAIPPRTSVRSGIPEANIEQYDIDGVIVIILWSLGGRSRYQRHSYPQERGFADPPLVPDLSDYLPQLLSDGSFNLDLVGESYQFHNYAAIKERYSVVGGDVLHAYAVAFCDYSNQFDSSAVAVAIDGQLVGRVSREESRTYFDLIHARGGAAIVSAELWFDPRYHRGQVSRRNSARISFPRNAQFDGPETAMVAFSAVRRTSKSEYVSYEWKDLDY